MPDKLPFSNPGSLVGLLSVAENERRGASPGAVQVILSQAAARPQRLIL